MVNKTPTLQTVSSDTPPNRQSRFFKFRNIELVIVILALCMLSFIAGNIYAHHTEKGESTTLSLSKSQLRAQDKRSTTIGLITRSSQTSVTVQDYRTGALQTYQLTATTKITKNGLTVSTPSLVVGKIVIISTKPAAPKTATRIVIVQFSPPTSSTNAPSGGSASI